MLESMTFSCPDDPSSGPDKTLGTGVSQRSDVHCSHAPAPDRGDSTQGRDDSLGGKEVDQKLSSLQGPWPPCLGDHLAVNFVDGFFLAEVRDIVDKDQTTVNISLMKPKKIPNCNPEKRQFWIWPSKEETVVVHRDSVLPLRPVL